MPGLNSGNSGGLNIFKIFVLYYLLALGSYNKNLLGHQFSRFIEDNRLAQHVIAFLTIFVLITLDSDLSKFELSITEVLIYASIVYVWFILSTKLDAHWNIIMTITLFSMYVYDRNMRMQEAEMSDDTNISESVKRETIESNSTYRKVMIAILATVTVGGTLLYSKRKVEQYGGGFDLFTYLLN